MATVVLKDVKKIYDNHVIAVHDFNLEIKDKEFVVFVGPSGCGKSTTLRMIAGLEEISEGTISIDGEIVNDLEPKDRNIAMVFQNYALYPHLTVFENMAFSLRLRRYIVKEPKMENGVQVKGIDQDTINANNLAIADYQKRKEGVIAEGPKVKERLIKEKTLIEKRLAKEEVKLAGLNKEKPGYEKLAKAVEDDKYVLDNLTRRIETSDSNNAKVIADMDAQIEKRQKENEYLSKNEVPLFISKKVKMPEQEIYDRVLAAAKTLGITEYLLRKPRALSGGQRQRVAIGRAMVRESKVFLMDEPLSNLDAKLRNQMRAEIILLRKKINSTFVYVTHDQTEAMTLGDRIVIMKDGYVQQVGTPQEVFDWPTNLFVATFIGAPQMNLFPAKLVKGTDGYHVEAYGKKFPIKGQKAKMLAELKTPTQEITLGVRPEHMELRKAKTTDALDLTISVNEMMGSEYHIHGIVGGDKQVVVRIPTISLGEGADASKIIAPGSEIHVGFEGKVMHLFDKEGYNILNEPEIKVKETSIEGVGQVEIKPDKLSRKDKKTKKVLESMVK